MGLYYPYLERPGSEPRRWLAEHLEELNEEREKGPGPWVFGEVGLGFRV